MRGLGMKLGASLLAAAAVLAGGAGGARAEVSFEPVAQAPARQDLWAEGFQFYRSGDYASAAVRLEALLAADPGDGAARVYLADCYARLGQVDRAKEVESGAGRVAVTGGDPVEVTPPKAAAAEDGCSDCGHKAAKRSRPFGSGVAFFGPAGTIGLYAELIPLPFLAGEAGWGLGIGRIQTWWVEAKFLPLRKPWSPFVGVGILGLFGVVKSGDFELLGPAGQALLERELHPYLTTGLMLRTGRGFSCQFAIGFALTGEAEAPVFVAPGYRMGWQF